MEHTLKRLTNEAWGFETNCFVCEPKNASGLRIPFFLNEIGREVTADFTLDDRFSGAPKYVHGGLLAAVLDEAMAWATIAIAHRFALTREAHSVFERPVRTGFSYHLVGTVVSSDEQEIAAHAEIVDHKQRICARGDAILSVLDMARAVDATGQDSKEVDPSYVRER